MQMEKKIEKLENALHGRSGTWANKGVGTQAIRDKRGYDYQTYREGISIPTLMFYLASSISLIREW